MFKSKLKSNSKTSKIIVGALSIVCSVILTVFIVHLFVRAGDLDPSFAPGDTMKTLEDIYSAMTIDCTLTDPPYNTDSPGTVASTMYTLQEIYDKAVNFPLPDTGQTTCYNATAPSTCPVAGFPGQDAEYTSANSFTCDLSYTDNNDGTVTDNCTGLMWKKCSEGMTYNAGTGACDDTASTYTWANALIQCYDLTFPAGSYADWRMPNINELFDIVLQESSAITGVKAAGAPYINQTAFPTTVSSYYWSSTHTPYLDTLAWCGKFSYGSVYARNMTATECLRCVRGD